MLGTFVGVKLSAVANQVRIVRSVKTERWDSNRAWHETETTSKHRNSEQRTHTQSWTETQVCTVVADLWLTPCRPNSDRISFMTAGKKFRFSGFTTDAVGIFLCVWWICSKVCHFENVCSKFLRFLSAKQNLPGRYKGNFLFARGRTL